MSVKLLTEHHLEFLCFTGSSEATLAKMQHCWKSHVTAHLVLAIVKLETFYEIYIIYKLYFRTSDIYLISLVSLDPSE